MQLTSDTNKLILEIHGKVSGIENKQSLICQEIEQIRKTDQEQTASLKEHMRRTVANEKAVEILSVKQDMFEKTNDKFIKFVLNFSKLVGLGGGGYVIFEVIKLFSESK